MVGAVVFFLYFALLFFVDSLIDFVFWAVVGLVLWFALDTAIAGHRAMKGEDDTHIEMEKLE